MVGRINEGITQWGDTFDFLARAGHYSGLGNFRCIQGRLGLQGAVVGGRDGFLTDLPHREFVFQVALKA